MAARVPLVASATPRDDQQDSSADQKQQGRTPGGSDAAVGEERRFLLLLRGEWPSSDFAAAATFSLAAAMNEAPRLLRPGRASRRSGVVRAAPASAPAAVVAAGGRGGRGGAPGARAVRVGHSPTQTERTEQQGLTPPWRADFPIHTASPGCSADASCSRGCRQESRRDVHVSRHRPIVPGAHQAHESYHNLLAYMRCIIRRHCLQSGMR